MIKLTLTQKQLLLVGADLLLVSTMSQGLYKKLTGQHRNFKLENTDLIECKFRQINLRVEFVNIT